MFLTTPAGCLLLCITCSATRNRRKWLQTVTKVCNGAWSSRQHVRRVKRMNELSIFISHGSKYADMANSLKQSLLRVQSSRPLSVKFSEDMPAGQDWRKWIDDNVRTADVFVLLYPHPSMDMGWCNYELGRFYQRDDNVVCIRNTDIPGPPKVFEPYESIKA